MKHTWNSISIGGRDQALSSLMVATSLTSPFSWNEPPPGNDLILHKHNNIYKETKNTFRYIHMNRNQELRIREWGRTYFQTIIDCSG